MNSFTINNFSNNEQILFIACQNNSVELVEWILFIDHNININISKELPFCIACENNSIDVAKYIYNMSHVNETNIEFDLISTICEEGYFKLLTTLYEFFSKFFNDLDYLNQYRLFYTACEYENINVAEILYKMNPSIPVYLSKHNLFWGAYLINNLPVINLLIKLYPTRYYVDIIDDKAIACEILSDLIINNNIEKISLNNIDSCYICYEKSNLYTSCKHFYCNNCLSRHYLHNDIKCPYCRKENLEYDICEII
jgi:hypothetical protein